MTRTHVYGPPLPARELPAKVLKGQQPDLSWAAQLELLASVTMACNKGLVLLKCFAASTG